MPSMDHFGADRVDWARRLLSFHLNDAQENVGRKPYKQLFARIGMTRFFFDFTARGRSLYDYRGDEFPSSQAAHDFAESIAEDLKHSLDGRWADWSVEVRNAEGQKFSKIVVGTPELYAA
jgi:hypothetical protein